MSHVSVLLKETIDYLNVREDGVYLDATCGRGGHTEAIVKQLTTGKVIVFDLDIVAIEEAKKRLTPYWDKLIFINDNYATLKKHCEDLGIVELDGFVFDLGVSSPQFDDPSRGFSYRYDSNLDMRMDQSQTFSAYHLVNEYPLNQLTQILRDYGEEPFAYPIAKKIVAARLLAPITTTGQLVEIIKSALPSRILHQKGHPAKQTFQAIRIEVNQELASVEKAVSDACALLKVGCRGCVITFHSLEDRIVKEIFKQLSTPPKTNRRLPQQIIDVQYQLIIKKPLTPSEEELIENPRSHSAKLRVIERKRG
jgi:16S rRNA (cytosine1402-N4)-methyltransferase